MMGRAIHHSWVTLGLLLRHHTPQGHSACVALSHPESHWAAALVTLGHPESPCAPQNTLSRPILSHVLIALSRTGSPWASQAHLGQPQAVMMGRGIHHRWVTLGLLLRHHAPPGSLGLRRPESP